MESVLGVRFRERGLLEQALTHRSCGSGSYERLEFLGDSLLGFIIADELYHRFPQLKEGDLTRLRARLVRQETLAEVARDLQLGVYLRLGEGEQKSGGYQRESILADVVEAVIGAVYQDAGAEAARLLVGRLLKSRLDGLSPESVDKDAKTRLQEFQQKQGLDLPRYDVFEVTGPDHAQRFTVDCVVPQADSSRVFRGCGRNRRIAEQEAAAAAWEALNGDG